MRAMSKCLLKIGSYSNKIERKYRGKSRLSREIALSTEFFIENLRAISKMIIVFNNRKYYLSVTI